jgi:L-ribulose-5-phosphate 3-epimerase
MLGYLFAGFDRILPLARRLGVKIALENLPISFLPTASGMMAALDRYGDDGLEIVYDVANAFFVGEDPSVGLRKVNQRLRLIHVSDTTRESYRHDPVGEGDVPFPSIAKTLREIQSPAPTILEIISREPDEAIQQSAKRLLTLGWPLGVDEQF